MFRATTPTHIFTLPFDTSLLQAVQITYQQFGRNILQKGKEDCTLTKNAIKLELTQEETLLFASTAEVLIQLRVVTNDGKVMASKIERKWAKECLDEEVLE